MKSEIQSVLLFSIPVKLIAHCLPCCLSHLETPGGHNEGPKNTRRLQPMDLETAWHQHKKLSESWSTEMYILSIYWVHVSTEYIWVQRWKRILSTRKTHNTAFNLKKSDTTLISALSARPHSRCSNAGLTMKDKPDERGAEERENWREKRKEKWKEKWNILKIIENYW